MMQVAQTNHTMPILHPSKQLIGTGMNKTLAFLISDDFCFKAKRDGIVEKIDNIEELAILKYDNGVQDAIDLSDKLLKNSGMGFYIHQKFQMVFKQGEKFEKGDILAVNPQYFQGKGKNVDYLPGALAKVAITSGDFSFEDSTLISESLGKKCTSLINMQKQVAFGKNAIIYNMKSVGDKVQPGDAIIEFMQSFDDPDTTDFLLKLQSQMGDDAMNEITHEKIETKYGGVITRIEMFYNCPFEELSDSLQKVITKYKATVVRRQKALGDIHADGVHIPPVERMTNSNKVGKQEFPPEGGVIMNIWVEYEDEMGMGDKLTYNTALKGVISRVLPDDEAPLSEYRSDEVVEGILAATGTISRMTSDIFKLLYGNKVLVELGKQIREIWRGER